LWVIHLLVPGSIMRSNRNIASFVCLAVLVSTMGCSRGPETAEVSGTIKLKGKAPNLDGLQVNFMGKDGRPVAATVAKDGTFKATRVPVGETQVGLSYVSPEAIAAIERLDKSRPQTPEEAAQGPGANFDPKLHGPEGKEYRPSAYKNPIPERLRDPRTSGKNITVEAHKENVLTWDVRP